MGKHETMSKVRLAAVCMLMTAACGPVGATEYFVDSDRGDDAASGTSAETAWKSLGKVNAAAIVAGDVVRFKRGGLWRGSLVPKSGERGKPVVYTAYGTGRKPILQQSVDRSKPGDWVEVRKGLWATLPRTIPDDVGIFICNHGEKWGTKKWANPKWEVPADSYWQRYIAMTKDLDYAYSGDEKRVYVVSARNPGERFDSIELAMTRHVVCQGGKHDIVYDGLWVRYGAAHGFGGGSTRNLTIRNCDVCWIGGGLQYWRKDEKTGKIVAPVRYGNGIEFWGTCHNNLVERNRLWECYDAATTNQGRDDEEEDVTWRDNVIWNSEYSFEYWNSRLTRNVIFEHNTCVDAGKGWAHAQRPDPNGAHLMYYHNRAATTNFVVRNNIFCRATEWTCRSGLDWRYGLVQDHNLVYNDGDVPVMRWLDARERKLFGWADYRALGFDGNGQFAEPLFRNPAKRDYRLLPNSPGLTLASDGTAVGARDMPGLDEDQSVNCRR